MEVNHSWGLSWYHFMSIWGWFKGYMFYCLICLGRSKVKFMWCCILFDFVSVQQWLWVLHKDLNSHQGFPWTPFQCLSRGRDVCGFPTGMRRPDPYTTHYTPHTLHHINCTKHYTAYTTHIAPHTIQHTHCTMHYTACHRTIYTTNTALRCGYMTFHHVPYMTQLNWA